MTSVVPTSESTVEGHAKVTALDWNVVPFEVGCARCGHDLRGLTDPKCPACGLEFEWSKAVPIEQLVCRNCGYHLYGLRDTRCPECGESFTWNQVLDDHHRRQKPLFEYRWRTEPFRSLVRTWWLTLRPGKLWRLIDIHDRPRVGPLLVIFVVASIALMIAGIVPAIIEGVVNHWRWIRLMAARGRSVPPMGLLQTIAWINWSNQHLYEFARIIGVWSFFTFASLLVFQQSMRRCRVRTLHVFRVCVFAVIGVAPLAAAVLFITSAVQRGFRIYWFSEAQIATVALALVVVFGAWSVGQGYRRYIRMPHCVGVVIAALVMGLLASGIACMWMFNSPYGIMDVLFRCLDSW